MATDLRINSDIIDKDIRKAETLPASFYRDQAYFDLAKERLFTRSWQFITDADRLTVPGQVLPCSILPGYVDEPIIISRDLDDNLQCLSNVCTHRGNLLVEGECHVQSLRCRYHGRRFNLDGKLASTPGFDNAACFPTERDNLSKVPFGSWGKFLFAAIDPAFSFDEVIGPMRERLSWMSLDKFEFDATRSQDYIVKANWALYCDNYLEGFHIPYVHPALAAAIDCKNYHTELHPYSNLQIGIASNPADAFDIPASSSDHGKNIAAYYYYLFPNMMFNFYPWGLSVNVIVPLAKDRTRISYITYVCDESKLTIGAGANVDKTEREDEDIIEQVQKGVQSHFYNRGRYSPEWEAGPHHFHQLLSKFLAD
ncbi:MAG: aromatic ring-hydroxylating dioxygenase subunit alpha [Candidatus Obscuribacterales bacterium]|nr:aromatic ring-hydroxylating dioxygenase subunit alpha [Candidatus Obscuribacterales bacterium]